jgi:hypothetical protein
MRTFADVLHELSYANLGRLASGLSLQAGCKCKLELIQERPFWIGAKNRARRVDKKVVRGKI